MLKKDRSRINMLVSLLMGVAFCGAISVGGAQASSLNNNTVVPPASTSASQKRVPTKEQNKKAWRNVAQQTYDGLQYSLQMYKSADFDDAAISASRTYYNLLKDVENTLAEEFGKDYPKKLSASFDKLQELNNRHSKPSKQDIAIYKQHVDAIITDIKKKTDIMIKKNKPSPWA